MQFDITVFEIENAYSVSETSHISTELPETHLPRHMCVKLILQHFYICMVRDTLTLCRYLRQIEVTVFCWQSEMSIRLVSLPNITYIWLCILRVTNLLNTARPHLSNNSFQNLSLSEFKYTHSYIWWKMILSELSPHLWQRWGRAAAKNLLNKYTADRHWSSNEWSESLMARAEMGIMNYE